MRSLEEAKDAFGLSTNCVDFKAIFDQWSRFDNTDGHIKASKKYGYAVKRNKGRREVKEYVENRFSHLLIDIMLRICVLPSSKPCSLPVFFTREPFICRSGCRSV